MGYMHINYDLTIINKTKDKTVKRNDIAKLYAAMIRQERYTSIRNNSKKINTAIIRRWSLSGLEYIKKRAWDIISGKEKNT